MQIWTDEFGFVLLLRHLWEGPESSHEGGVQRQRALGQRLWAHWLNQRTVARHCGTPSPRPRCILK